MLHGSKRTQKFKPSKDSVLGSQAFEAKMRCLVELKTDMNEPTTKHLCILKSNYLASKLKQSSYELSFDENALFFTNTGNRVPLDFLRGKANNTSKFQDNKTTLLDEALKLSEQGNSLRKIEAFLKEKYGAKAPKKSTINNWIKSAKS